MKVEVKEKKEKVHVLVALDARKRDQSMVTCDTKHVLKWLKKNSKKYNFDELQVLQKPKKPLHNSISHSRLSGEWVFALQAKVSHHKEKEEKVVVVTNSAPTTLRSKTKEENNTQKALKKTPVKKTPVKKAPVKKTPVKKTSV